MRLIGYDTFIDNLKSSGHMIRFWKTSTVKPLKIGHPSDHKKIPVSTVDQLDQVLVGIQNKSLKNDDR